MSHTIFLPSDFGFKNGNYSHIQEFLQQVLYDQDEVCIDASNLKFISPVGFCLVRSLVSHYLKNSIKLTWKYPKDENAKSFLTTIKLYQPNENKFESKSHFPLTKVTQENIDQTEFIHSLCSILKHQGITDNKLLEILEYSLPEIIQNIFHHSGVQYGYVSMMLYKNTHLQVAIVDNGMGIRESLTKNPRFPARLIDDAQAISLALYPKISGTADKNLAWYGNGWEGLYWVSEAIKKNKGQLYIHSGNGLLLVHWDKYEYTQWAFWQGTVVCMNISLKHLFDIGEIFTDKHYSIDDNLFDIHD